MPRLFRIFLLVAALLLAFGSLAGAQPVKRAPDGPLVTIHAPQTIPLELALDEVELDWSRAPNVRTQASSPQAIPAGDARIAETGHARARADFARAVDRQTLAAKARLLRDANPGAEVHLVVYEPGLPRSPATRKLLTREVGLLLEPDQDVAAILAGLAANAPRPVPGVPHGYVVETSDPLAAVDLAEALRIRPGVTAAYPLLQRMHAKRGETSARAHATLSVYTDALIPDQWYLQPLGANVEAAWQTAQGGSVVIGIVDDGLQYTHPDLQANYSAPLSWNFNTNGPDPGPALLGSCTTTADCHGTAVAGIAAARGGNGIGIAGVAPLASIAGIRILGGATTDAQEAAALGHQKDSIHVLNNSWGPTEPLGRPGPLAEAAHEIAATQGRSGKGRVFVWAAGNSAATGDNCNFDGWGNSRHGILVGALTDSGTKASYSEPCSALFVSAPSSGGSRSITTTDLVGAAGYDSGDYTSTFGGTSAAAPIVSGVAALMLSVNPELSRRDVKHILARTAVRVAAADPAWTGGLFPHNEKYGFGLVDAAAAVSLAASWTTLPTEVAVPAVTRRVNRPIPDNLATGITDIITIPEALAGFIVEHVDVVLDATHPNRGDLEVQLTSPAGVVSRLATPRTSDSGDDFADWRFGSVRNWGEPAAGTWQLRVIDTRVGFTGAWNSWTLRIYGYFPSAAEPRITLRLNQPAQRSGETLRVTAEALPGTAPRTVDVYAGVRLPDGGFLYLSSGGSLTPSPQPFIRNWTLGAAGGEIFRHTWSGADLSGCYTWHAALFDAATAELIGAVAAAPMSVANGTQPAVCLDVNRTAFAGTQQLALAPAVIPTSGATAADLYIALQRPDGGVSFLTADGRLTPLQQPTLANWNVAAWAGPLFSHTFTGAEPAGLYRWLAGFARPGSLDFLAPLSAATFYYSP